MGMKGGKGQVTFICVNKQTSTEYILKHCWLEPDSVQSSRQITLRSYLPSDNSEELCKMKDRQKGAGTRKLF